MRESLGTKGEVGMLDKRVGGYEAGRERVSQVQVEALEGFGKETDPTGKRDPRQDLNWKYLR